MNQEPCQSVALLLAVVLGAERDIVCANSLMTRTYTKMSKSCETAAKQLGQTNGQFSALFKAF